uniref:putative baseplate assembly protein n=1 Tax=Sulfurovum sp. TaxID=1969726 RepID=UPI0025D26670
EEEPVVSETEGITPGNNLVGATDLMQENLLEITPEIEKQLPDLDKAIYLGFDKPFGEGFISLLFVLPKKYWDLYQYLEWSYYSQDGWKALNVKDGTHGLMQTGTCEFIAPLDQTDKLISDQNLYWLKIKIVERKLPDISPHSPLFFYPVAIQRFLMAKYDSWQFNVNSSPKKSFNLKACEPELMAFHPALHTPKDEKDAQVQISAIYLNTIWASQSETVKEEYVGSSDGSPNQNFKLLRPAVKKLQIWVKEFLEPENDELVYEVDEEKGFWVLWKEIAYIYDAKPTDRVFMLDSVSGEVRFGDGNFGLIPPIGKDNIKADYLTGGGKQGNVPKEKIKNLVSGISSIDKIQNHLEASGGSDEESIESLIKRAPKTLRAKDRAITFEDYEILTKESSTDVAKVKVIPNFNNFGKYETNWVTAVIAPYSQEEQPECTERLIRNVRSYLEARAPVVTNVQVISPQYAVIDLEIDIVLKQWDLVPIVKDEIQKKLASFLQPIYGGYEGEGWEFGTLPCFSDFFALLEDIDGIEQIKTLKMHIAAGDKKLTMTSEDTQVLDVSPYILVCNGTHTLNMKGA